MYIVCRRPALSMEMGELTFEEVLETNRVEIVQRLQLDRTFLFDYLRSKNVFDFGDCDLVQAEKTREQKAAKFLDVLTTKGEEGYYHFVDALQLLNPSLYERITGEKATARPSPLVMGTGENFFFGPNGYIPDLDIMSNHLKRTMADLQDMTIRYEEVLKQKEQMEKKLSRTSCDLLEKNRLIDELERRYFDTEAMLMESHSSAKKVVEGAAQHCQLQDREMLERTHFIIALQMKLLTTKEEVDTLREKLEESNKEREDLRNRFAQISKNYDNQRRESIKLTEKLEIQKDNIQRAEEIKVKYRQLQFTNQKLQEEKEEALKELEDLKHWTEALKARYDIVEEDRKQTQETHESTVADFSELRDKADELELRLTISVREKEELRKRCKDYEQTANTYREQRDLFEKTWKETSLEREQFRKERDDLTTRFAEVIQSRDEAIDRQMEYTRQFEQKLKKTTEELDEVKERLYQTEIEMEESRKAKLQRNPSDLVDHPYNTAKKHGKNLHLDSEKALEAKLDGSVEDDDVDSIHSSEDSFDWRTRRTTTDIIDSVKKRVATSNSQASRAGGDSVEEASSPPAQNEKGLSLDEQLDSMIPERRSLSPAAQKSFSLNRNRSLFKSCPTYNTLECMFGASVCNTTPFYTDSSSSLYASFRSTQSDKTGQQRRQSDHSAKSLSVESGVHELMVNDVSKAKGKPKSPKRGRKKQDKSPSRPRYFKSVSSPSKIIDFVQRKKSSGSSVSSYEENSVRSSAAQSDRCREETSSSSDESGLAKRHPSFKEASSNPSYNKISKSQCTSITLSLDGVQNGGERVLTPDEEEVANALMSPTLNRPFRERSSALSADERPRSSSAPNCQHFDFQQTDIKTSTSD